MADAQALLDQDNLEAWHIYGRLAGRLVRECGLAPDLFRRLVEHWSTRDVLDLLERLTVMHDILQPPRTEP